MRARLAWTLAGVTVLCGVADILVTASYRDLSSEETIAEHGFPFLTAAVVLSSLLGATIITRYAKHPIGWLISLIGVTGGVSAVTEAYSIWVLSADGPGSATAAAVLGWVSALLGGQVAIGGITMIFLLAPDGRLLSARWRYAVAAATLGLILCTVGLGAGDPTEFDIETMALGPTRQRLFGLGFLLIIGALTAGLASMLVRLHRSRGVLRQQVRLVATAAVLVLGGLVNMLVVQAVNGGEQTWAASVPMFASFVLLPVLHTVAVLRYRLHDVEVIVNRALVVAAGTAFAAVGYTMIVLVVGEQLTHGADTLWISLLGTAVVALAFQPLRRRVVQLADRLAYGPRARPYVALSDFSSRLATAPTVDTLLPAVADAAGRAVSARGSRVTLDVTGIGQVAAGWGEQGDEGTLPCHVPILSGRVVLGQITVFVPKGRGLRGTDERLLEALADQAAVAFRNTAMEAELAEHVAGLARNTDELTRSRARLVEADTEARRTLEAAISRDVLPGLVELPEQIDAARVAVAARSADNGLDGLVLSMNRTLEALRDLTHGIFPTQLARAGVEPALRSFLARVDRAPALSFDESARGRRFPARVETAVYFCCTEVARSGPAMIEIGIEVDELVLRIGPVSGAAVDLQPVSDRAAAVGGSVSVVAEVLELRVPVEGAVASAVGASSGGCGPGP